ncbi:MAG: GNAT family N-acetyltransferase [Tannerella sp.]|nr:GNAT family N-acetyltransferase [Tannerella sp.]
MSLKIKKVASDYPYNLLLLADETIEGINKYLFDSDVYIAELPGTEEPIAVFCLYPIDENTIELKNIAVAESYQGKGIGSVLLDKAYRIAKEKEYWEMIVGTADCGIKQIRFYERNGFVKYDVKENFFLEIYDQPIYENGVQLKDMVMLKKEI